MPYMSGFEAPPHSHPACPQAPPDPSPRATVKVYESGKESAYGPMLPPPPPVM